MIDKTCSGDGSQSPDERLVQLRRDVRGVDEANMAVFRGRQWHAKIGRALACPQMTVMSSGDNDGEEQVRGDDKDDGIYHREDGGVAFLPSQAKPALCGATLALDPSSTHLRLLLSRRSSPWHTWSKECVLLLKMITQQSCRSWKWDSITIRSSRLCVQHS